MKYRSLILCTVIVIALTACERPAAEPQPAFTAQVVDSILPIAEEVRRFRAEHGVTSGANLQGGKTSRDELVQAFIRALERRDATSLREMSIDAAEFIAFYYPASIYAQEPYRQSPAFVWFQFQQHSQQGITRVLNRFGGRPTGFDGYECGSGARIQGENRLWENCLVRWQHDPPTRLFGSIIERGGLFKFVSYTNHF